MIFVGVDWAEAHHDVHVEDGEGRRLGRARLPEGVDGIARFHDLVGGFADEPGEVVVGIETDRGLFVAALVAAGYQVYAVNPLSTSRYRDRHSVGGAKSDPGDAKVLADMVRTDRHNHRLIAGDSVSWRRSRSWPEPIRPWCGPRAGRPTCCAPRCASSTRPLWSPSTT